MEVIILAAGHSKRLKKYTEDRPKCLVEVAGRTILERQLEAINGTHATKCIIVTGFMSDKVQEFVRENHHKYSFEIELANNDLYLSTDNAYSLSIAMERVKGSVIILDGDIIFETDLLTKLFFDNNENAMLCDSSRTPDDEDCKILDSNGFATRIGKKVDGQYIYTSMIKLGGRFLSEFIEELNKDRRNKEWYSEPLDRSLAINGSSVKILFSNNYYRTEIDTEDDLLMAEQEIIARGLQ